SPRPNKLEKADILEMTVDYIRKISDRKPGSPGSSSSEDKALTPFADGYSRCIEEVETFLENQRQLQPEVRNKLVSHCRELLSGRDITPNQADQSPRVSSREKSDDDVKPNVSRHNSDAASCDSASSDEELLEKDFSDVSGVTSGTCAGAPGVSTTALVAPFQHTSSVSTSGGLTVLGTSGAPADSASKSDGENGGTGLKFAGALKLICGGNVFIVLDQQNSAGLPNQAGDGPSTQTILTPGPPTQQLYNNSVVIPKSQTSTITQQMMLAQIPTNVPTTLTSTVTQPCNLGASNPNSMTVPDTQQLCSASLAASSSLTSSNTQQLVYNPSLYAASGLNFLSTLPQMALASFSGIPSLGAVSSSQNSSVPMATSFTLPAVPLVASSPSSPQEPSSPPVSQCARNDVNNNDVYPAQQISSMWRPW
ncbi:hypothetical protein BaRGS_00006966, partial [Batillaria attramentaria]